MGWPAQASIYEINTWVWLAELTRQEGRAVGLGEVPPRAWDAVCLPGVDAVWLMGVWTRSPLAAETFRRDPASVAHYRSLLPDYADADVVGSAYAIRNYVVDPVLGGFDGLARARAELDRRGCALVLDYVPNHTAPDHPWVATHPDRYVTGTRDDLERDPAGWFEVAGAVIARGRDPFFPPWPDVAQLDLFAPSARIAAIETLRSIAERADAVRCDMAMLALTDVFGRTWGDKTPHRPSGEFWEQVIGEVRAVHSDFGFLAEAYWGTEGQLVEQGFDACYDKELYDHLVGSNPAGVRADVAWQHANRAPFVRFVENHDEPRAADAFAPAADVAASVAIATLPGTTLWHDGQFEGRRARLPVTLGRRPDETPSPGRRAFFERLLAVAPQVRRGEWRPVETTGWPDNGSCQQLAAWTWSTPSSRALVVVNLADQPAQARVHPSWPDLDGTVQLRDALSGTEFERSGREIVTDGLYVDLPPWGTHVLVAN